MDDFQRPEGFPHPADLHRRHCALPFLVARLARPPYAARYLLAFPEASGASRARSSECLLTGTAHGVIEWAASLLVAPGVRYCGASERRFSGTLRKYRKRSPNVEDDPEPTWTTKFCCGAQCRGSKSCGRLCRSAKRRRMRRREFISFKAYVIAGCFAVITPADLAHAQPKKPTATEDLDCCDAHATYANGMVRPRSCPTSKASWRGAPDRRSTPCPRSSIPQWL